MKTVPWYSGKVKNKTKVTIVQQHSLCVCWLVNTSCKPHIHGSKDHSVLPFLLFLQEFPWWLLSNGQCFYHTYSMRRPASTLLYNIHGISFGLFWLATRINLFRFSSWENASNPIPIIIYKTNAHKKQRNAVLCTNLSSNGCSVRNNIHNHISTLKGARRVCVTTQWFWRTLFW